MKILIHSHLYPNNIDPTFGTFVYYYSKALCELNHQVTVVAPIPWVLPGIKKSHPWYRYKNVELFFQDGPLKIYHPRFFSIPKRKLFYLRGDIMFLSAKKFYLNLLKNEKFDIIHCHVALPDGRVGSILSKIFNIPYGVTIHGADFYLSAKENYKNLALIKKVLEGADFVGLVSQTLKNQMLKFNINPKSQTTKTIYNGIYIPGYLPEVDWPDRQNDVIRLLSVGHAIRRKGYDYVIRALATLLNNYDGILYYIIGDGDDLNYFKKVAEESRVKNHVIFLGRKSNAEVLSYMKKADIFILPSWDEAFGIVYIEAMAMKLPIIGVKNEGISEIIKDGYNGFLVSAKSEKEISKVLSKLITDPKLRSKIGQAGYDTVKDVFTWRENAKFYEMLYNQAIVNWKKKRIKK